MFCGHLEEHTAHGRDNESWIFAMPAMRQPLRLSFALPWRDRTRAAPVEYASLPLWRLRQRLLFFGRPAAGTRSPGAPGLTSRAPRIFTRRNGPASNSQIVISRKTATNTPHAEPEPAGEFPDFGGHPISDARIYLPRNSAITSSSTSTATTTSSANILRSLNCATMNSYSSPAVFNFSSTSI